MNKAYRTYRSMLSRCYNKNVESYALYGGRGIKVEWDTFEEFYKDMKDPPTPSHSIDRINNNKNYSKNNCRWATSKEQANNRRSSRHLTINGVSKTCAQWAEYASISRSLIHNRLKRGKKGLELLTPKTIDKNKKTGIE